MGKEHFEPKPLLIAERFHFHRREQNADESITEYVAELRRLASTCEFKAFLDDALRDRLVCGLRSDSLQRRLLSEDKLTLDKALKIAQSLEMVDKKAKSLKAADNPIRRLSQRKHRTAPGRQQQGKERCSRCGRTNHAANNCKFSDATCHNCGKKGHIAPACRSNKSRKSSKYQQQHHSTKYVDANSDDSGPDEIQLHAVGSSTKSSPPIMVNVQVQGEDLPQRSLLYRRQLGKIFSPTRSSAVPI